METVETFKETMRKVIAASSLDAAIQKTNLLENSSTKYKNPRTSQPYINQLDQAQDKLSSTEGKKIAKIHPEKAQPSPSNIGKPETSH
jgi:fatty acid-binding protein DegV